MSDLLDRLRGIYTVPVNDGAGLLNGKDTFTRHFPVPPIQREAADEIERLRGLWLTEQRIRLEQAEFLEMYAAAKAKVKIEHLEARIHHLRGLLETAVDAYECGHWNGLLCMKQLHLTQAWWNEAKKAGGDDVGPHATDTKGATHEPEIHGHT